MQTEGVAFKVPEVCPDGAIVMRIAERARSARAFSFSGAPAFSGSIKARLRCGVQSALVPFERDKACGDNVYVCLTHMRSLYLDARMLHT